MKIAILAKGRLRPTTGMNKTEAAYADFLKTRNIAGEIIWWSYEGIKLKLADNTFYTPDFIVMTADGFIEVHEVKGHWEDDARVKIKVAARMFPFKFIGITGGPKKGWIFEEF